VRQLNFPSDSAMWPLPSLIADDAGSLPIGPIVSEHRLITCHTSVLSYSFMPISVAFTIKITEVERPVE